MAEESKENKSPESDPLFPGPHRPEDYPNYAVRWAVHSYEVAFDHLYEALRHRLKKGRVKPKEAKKMLDGIRKAGAAVQYARTLLKTIPREPEEGDNVEKEEEPGEVPEVPGEGSDLDSDNG